MWRAGCAALAVAGVALAAGAGELIHYRVEGVPALALEIEYPPEGAVLRDHPCGVFVAGRTELSSAALRRFDVVVALDTSRSTAQPAGADVDGDGVVGQRRLARVGAVLHAATSDPDDSVLGAEVAAAHRILERLDARLTRVAILSFAGAESVESARSGKGDAQVWLNPTTDFAAGHAALDAVLARGAGGDTNLAAGLASALALLPSAPEPTHERLLLVFTDGVATLPFGPEHEAENLAAALEVARRARAAGVRIHSFAVGPAALAAPRASVELAQRTGGRFIPVPRPFELPQIVDEVQLAELDSLEVGGSGRALTLEVGADGSFAGLLAMAKGAGEIEVRARAGDGSEVRWVRAVVVSPEAEALPVPPELRERHSRLEAACLAGLRRGGDAAELRLAELLRQRLREEIERERARAIANSQPDRRELRLEVEKSQSAN